MSIKNSALPDTIDAPSSEFFLVGNYKINEPFKGSNCLQILTQDCCSINGVFPTKGSSHEVKSDFYLFNIGEQNSIGHGMYRATLFYCNITDVYKERFKQQVQFYGIRKREVSYTEKYETTSRSTTQQTFSINGTFISYPVVKIKPVVNSRQNKVFDIVAREPFSQEVTCTKHSAFQNTWKDPSIKSDFIKQKEIIKDINQSIWKKTIQEHYDSNKHPNTIEFTMPSIPQSFEDTIATNYLSETSTPSAGWYSSQIGKDGYIVQSSVIEDFIGGGLRKIEWVETQYK